MQTVAELVREIALPPPADAAERLALRLIDAAPCRALDVIWTVHQRTGSAQTAFWCRVLHHLLVLLRVRVLLEGV
jgi:hypothetical protein